MDRNRWTELLRASGFSHEDVCRWHRSLERHAPEKHREFLEYLRVPPRAVTPSGDRTG